MAVSQSVSKSMVVVAVPVGVSVSMRITMVARSMAYNFVDASITRMTVVMSIGRVMSLTIT